METENGNISIDLGNLAKNPLNIFYLFVFYSPLIISSIIFSSIFVYQNFKGAFYLFFLIVAVTIRSFYLKNSKQSDEYKLWEAQLNPTCNKYGKFTEYGHPGFNLFVIAFSFMYVCLPMMINKDINYLVFGVFSLFLGADIGVKYLRFNCLKDVKQILSNISMGALFGTLIVLIFYSLGLSQHLFFNELSSNNELCKVQSKQKFKCTVSNNGQVVGTVMK
jgi:hypothetical protein